MNVENILKVADAIEQHSIPDLGFNMVEIKQSASPSYPDMSGHNCGTVACIVGWAGAVFKEEKSERNVFFSRHSLQEKFGISESMGIRLTCPHGRFSNQYGPSDAVRTLRHLAATGEVRWELP